MHRNIVKSILALLILPGGAGILHAQQTCTIDPPSEGGTEGSVTLPADWTGGTLAVRDQSGTVEIHALPAGAESGTAVKTALTGALKPGQSIEVRGTKQGGTAVECRATVASDNGSSAAFSDPDERDGFEASFYVGLAIDTFAGEARTYLNPDASGKVHERGVFGFDFAYRLWDQARGSDVSANDRWRQQTWIYGETVHGTRSAELDCNAHSDIAICSDSFAVTTNPLNDGIYLLRNATSLEAFMGVRHEFLGVNIGGANPARAYIKGQVGFLTVSRNVDDVVDLHHGAVGLLATKGKFQGSYLEIGFGRSDLFREHRRRRIKIDGLLSRDIGGGVSFFAQMTVDVDGGSGGDSIQSYIGLDFDISEFALFKVGQLFSN